MVTAILLLALSATAPLPFQESIEDDSKTVVVTATRLGTTEKTLTACIARNCPPDQEVAAALAHAENQFLAGDYREARHTLHGTIGRVDRQAKSYPVPVANIWNAESRIAAHLGEGRAMQSGQFEAIDALKAGLAKTDNRVLLQRLQVADAFIKSGQIDMGRAAYRTVVGQARALKVPGVEGTALLRIALLDAGLAGLPGNALHPFSRFGSTSANYRAAQKSVATIMETTNPELEGFRQAARLIGARLQAHRGDLSGIDAIAADYAQNKPQRPVLLFAPMMEDEGTFFDPNRVGLLGEQDFERQWIDVTFLVNADGRVKDVEILRQSPDLRNDWTTPVLATVAQRRYAPIDVPADLEGLRRVERYSMTAFWGNATGSNVRARLGQPRLEMLDLTADTPRSAASGGSSSATPAE